MYRRKRTGSPEIEAIAEERQTIQSAGSTAAPCRRQSCSVSLSAAPHSRRSSTAGGHRRQAGGARDRRGRRVRRPLRGGRRGGHPLARRRLSRRGPFPGRRPGQEGRSAVHHRPAPLPGGLRRGQVAGRRRQQPARILQDAARARRGARQDRQHRGLDARRPPARVPVGAGADAGRDGGADAPPASISNSPRSGRRLSGRIDRRLVSVGNLVQADHAADDDRRARSDRLLFRHRRAPLFRLRARCPRARRHHAGRRRRPRRVGPGRRPRAKQSFKGKLDFAENRIDNATGTMRVRARFANPDGILQPGMFGRINVPGSLPHKGMLVPDEAIGADQDRRIVYVVETPARCRPSRCAPARASTATA